jgi:hypothetical protein
MRPDRPRDHVHGMSSSGQAVQRSLRALDRTAVVLEGVRAAREVTTAVGPARYLHAGPPLALEELPGPMLGALLGALVFEGEARDLDQARAMVQAREVELVPGHHVGGVGAMAGIVTPRMPVVVASGAGRTAFSPLNEGLGRALRFGSNDPATLSRLTWLAKVAGPLLDRAISSSEQVELMELVAEGLRRGDECHNRNVATSAALLARLAPAIVRAAERAEDAADVLAYIAGNRHFFLSFSITAAKLVADLAHGVDESPIVTAMAGNGRRLGIRVSGTGERWFTAPAPLGEPRFFEGYDASQATPTMGDSFITETAGYGAFALTAAPAITSFIGGTVQRCRELVSQMRTLCAGRSERLLIPSEGFAGTPLGIDVRRVAELGVAPVVNNGLAHREAGVGQVGAGITRLPVEPFAEAASALSGDQTGVPTG